MPHSEDEILLVTDGAYYGDDNIKQASAKNVQLITTSLTGVETPDILAEFEFSDDGKEVLRCPAGHKPKACCYRVKRDQCHISFPASCCENCPYRNKCRAKEQKKSFVINVSAKTVDRANNLKKLSTPRYRHLAHIRNGIECRPSLLRRRLDADNIPVLGYLPSKCFFMVKTGASNLIAFFSYRRRQREKCAIFA